MDDNHRPGVNLMDETVKMPRVFVKEYDGERLGIGYSSAEKIKLTNTALEVTSPGPDPLASGQAVLSRVEMISEFKQIQERLGISVEADGRYAFVKASAKAQFLETSKFDSSSTFIFARCIVQNPVISAARFDLTQEVKELLETQNRLDAFKEAYGDYFARSLYTGGEFFCVIRIHSVSSEVQKEISANVQASLSGLIASASVKTSIESMNKSSSTRVSFVATMYQTGGSGAEIKSTLDFAEVKQRIDEFPGMVKANPFPFKVELAAYSTIYIALPTPEELASLDFAYRDANDRKLYYIERRNDLLLALENIELYENLPSFQVLQEEISTYAALINAVVDHVNALSRGRRKTSLVFDPMKLEPPILVPNPIRLTRKNSSIQHAAPEYVTIVDINNFNLLVVKWIKQYAKELEQGQAIGPLNKANIFLRFKDDLKQNGEYPANTFRILNEDHILFLAYTNLFWVNIRIYTVDDLREWDNDIFVVIPSSAPLNIGQRVRAGTPIEIQTRSA